MSMSLDDERQYRRTSRYLAADISTMNSSHVDTITRGTTSHWA
jgi:hypothetical protein